MPAKPQSARQHVRNIGAISATTLLFTMFGGGVAAVAATDTELCTALPGMVLNNVEITDAYEVPASETLPEYCRVIATEVGTDHDIEVRLPAEWQGRFVQQGGGGFDGHLPSAQLDSAGSTPLKMGAVHAANNGGHRDPSGAVLLNDPAKQDRYAHSAIEVTATFSRDLIAVYYGGKPNYSYYQGCSNGGRGALNAAAKYSDMFDGVIAGAPTLNLTGQIASWVQNGSAKFPSAEKLAAITTALTEDLDGLDGLEDGIISNTATIKFDPERHIPENTVLTEEEIAAVSGAMNDLVLENGQIVYSAYNVPSLTNPVFLGEGHMRYLVENDPSWSSSSFDIEQDLERISATIDAQFEFSPSLEDLADFMDQGKKIMIWHGGSDGLLTPNDVLRNWETVTNIAGTDVVDENSRIYIAPGVAHCSGGPGADKFDLLPEMMEWVETGDEPAIVTASKIDSTSGETLFTRPLCEYPTYPHWNGTGQGTAATEFDCVAYVPGQLIETIDASPASGSDVAPGDKVTYTATFENSGGDFTAIDRKIWITDILDDADWVDNLTHSENLDVAANLQESNISFTGNIAPGETATLSFQVEVREGDSLGNQSLLSFLTTSDEAPMPTCEDNDHLCTIHTVQVTTVTPPPTSDDGTGSDNSDGVNPVEEPKTPVSGKPANGETVKDDPLAQTGGTSFAPLTISAIVLLGLGATIAVIGNRRKNQMSNVDA